MTNPNLGPLIPVILWPGSGSTPIGRTPFQLFDDDDIFVEDAPKVAKWICSSLGHPIMAVELTDEIIYGQFEQSIVEFSAQVNEFNMREQMMSLQGTPSDVSITQQLIRGSPLPYVVEVSQVYGTEVGVGGPTDFKKGYIQMVAGQQDYDLSALWSAVSESGNHIEVRRIWHDRSPAMNRFFDPFAGGAGQGIGLQNLMGEFGWGSYSVASQYLLMPIYETLLRVQAIELNDMIRRSSYGFEIKNNKLRLFPIPGTEDAATQMWFEYVVTSEKFSTMIGAPGGAPNSGGVISDYSNAPYDVMMYTNINDVGKRWIWKYTLALCKIILGGIRSKYDTIPIPNSELRLDGLTMRQEGQAEIEMLMQQLRESLEQTGKSAQMEKAKNNEMSAQQIMKFVPNLIYIG
jgi:hypothetical protein